MSVHYRFKSARDYDTITFDGLHISIKDLKNAIVQQKKIGRSSDFDLRVTNAQTDEVYEDENALIAKNTSLLIARVPVSTPKPRHWEGYGGNDTPPAKIDEGGPIGKATDLANLDAPEDDKIKAMMSQSTQEYDPSNYQKIKGSNQVGPVPPGYRCYKCHHFGHWIKDCPSNKTGEVINDGSGTEFKKSTGIPRDFMIPVDGPKVPGAMLLPNGTWAVPALDMQAYNQKGPHQAPEPTPKPEIPEDLLCSICSDLLADAVMIPCCGNSFCDECIRFTLLESEDRECPDCHEKDVSPATLIPNRFLRKSVATFKNTTGYEKAPINRRKLITEIPAQTDLLKQSTPPPAADSTENGARQDDKTVISEADSTEHAKAGPEFGQEAGLTPTDQFLQPPYRTPEQPPGCSPLSDFNSPQHLHGRNERVGDNKDRYTERPGDKYHYIRKSSGSPSPDRQRRRRSRSGSPRVKSTRSPPDAVSTPTRDEMQAALGPPHGFMPPRTEAPPHGVVQPPFNAAGIPPGMSQVGHMQGPPMNMPPGFPPMGQQPPPHMGGYPQQGPPPANFGMPPPGVPPPGAFMPPGSYPIAGIPPSGHPPFNPQLGALPPNFGPPTSNNPPTSRGREFSRSGRNRSPPKVIDDPLEAFNRIIAEKDERRARRARQAAAAARKSWSRSPSPGRRSYSRSPPPMRRRIGSRSPPPRRRSRSRSFTSSRSRSRSFSKSPQARRKVSPLRRQSPPPLRGEPPPRRGGPPPSSQHYRSPPHDRGRASPPPPIRRGAGRKPEREHDSRDYRDNRDYHDDRAPGRDYRDKQRGREPNRRGDSRERQFDDRSRRDYRGNGPPQPQHNQWANQNRDGPNQWAPQPHQGFPGGGGMNRFQPRNFGPPLSNPMPPNMQPPRRFDDIRPPGVEEPPIPGLESEPPVIDEFKKKTERRESPRRTYSPKVEREKERDKEKDRDRDRHSRRSRTPEFRNPSPKDEVDKHKRRRSKSSESSHKKKDKDYSEDEKKSKSKDKKKKDKREKEKKKKDKKDKHKKDKDKKSKEEFRQVIPKSATTDDEDEDKSKKKKKSHKEQSKSDNEKLSAEAKKKEERRLRFIEDEKRRKAEEAAKKQNVEGNKEKIVKELKEDEAQQQKKEEKELEEHVNTEMNLYSDVLTETEVVPQVVTDMFEQEIPQSDQIGSGIDEFRTQDNLLEVQQEIETENFDNIQEEIVDNNFIQENNYIQDNNFNQENNDFVQEEVIQNAPIDDIPQGEATEEGEIHDELDTQNESVLLIEDDPSILELHSTADMAILENVENDNLVPLPEKSKWETDEDGLIPSSPHDSFDQKDSKKDKIDKDVLKRAENAIFAKAINAIKPREIEIKKISSDRAKLYSDEKLKEESKNDVILISTEVKPKASLVEKPKVIPEKPRIPVKARLGIKIEDDLSPFSRRERRVDLKDLRRRERSKSPRFRKEVDLREKRMLDSKSRNDREKFKQRKDKSEDKRKERKRRSRSRSSSSEPRRKKKDKKTKKEKDKKREEKDGDKPKASTSEKRKSAIDEANFEPDYDLEIVESEAEKKSKKAERTKESVSDSSDSSTSSSEEERKKKKKKRKKKRKRSTSSSESESSSDSSDSERERKKRKHKKSKKKKKKNKHK